MSQGDNQSIVACYDAHPQVEWAAIHPHKFEAPGMKIGVSVPNLGPVATLEAVKIVAQKAEALGYNSLWTVERLLW